MYYKQLYQRVCISSFMYILRSHMNYLNYMKLINICSLKMQLMHVKKKFLMMYVLDFNYSLIRNKTTFMFKYKFLFNKYGYDRNRRQNKLKMFKMLGL